MNLFKTYVRSILECNTCTWSPHLKTDIHLVESVQRNFTRRVCQRSNIRFSSYNDRLKALNLESLHCRRVKRDLVLMYQIFHNHIDIAFSSFFIKRALGGHNLQRHNQQISRKSAPKTLIRDNFFTFRVIKYWNKLPQSVVDSPSIDSFTNRLRRIDINI